MNIPFDLVTESQATACALGGRCVVEPPRCPMEIPAAAVVWLDDDDSQEEAA